LPFVKLSAAKVKQRFTIVREPDSMTLNISFKLLPILALVLGIASLVAPRFLNVFVAIFLIVYALVGFGFIR
jgi:hypothetical protein